VREKQGPHDSRISQLRAKIVAKRVASQIKGQRDNSLCDALALLGKCVRLGVFNSTGAGLPV
jgi:hypothetical protein